MSQQLKRQFPIYPCIWRIVAQALVIGPIIDLADDVGLDLYVSPHERDLNR